MNASENVGLASNADEALARALRDAGFETPNPDHDDEAWALAHALAALGYEVRPIDSGTAEGYESEAGVPKSRRPSSSASAVPGAQATEAADAAAEAAYQDSQNTDPQYRPSAAVAPLEPIPTDWGVGPLTHPVAVAPSSAEVGGSLDVEALVAALDFITSRFGSEAHDVGGVWGVVRRELPAAYADAIRKRDPDPTGGGA